MIAPVIKLSYEEQIINALAYVERKRTVLVDENTSQNIIKIIEENV